MSFHQPAAGLCAATALFVCGVAGFPVPPSLLPASEGSLTLGTPSEAAFAPGADLHIEGAGFADNAAVTVAMYPTSRTLATVVADDNGTIDASVLLPSDLEGTHTIVALGLAPDRTSHNLQSKIKITATVASDVRELALTGVNSAALIAGGLGMIVAGFVLVRSAVFRRPLKSAN